MAASMATALLVVGMGHKAHVLRTQVRLAGQLGCEEEH